MRSHDVKHITQLYKFLVNLSTGNLTKVNLPLVHTQLHVSQAQMIENHQYFSTKLGELERRIQKLEKKD